MSRAIWFQRSESDECFLWSFVGELRIVAIKRRAASRIVTA